MMTMTKEQALKDLKQRYGTPGDPMYMAGISTIKDEYSNLLTVKEIRDFLAQSRTYTVHYAYKPVKFNPYYIWSLRQRIQVDLTETSKISQGVSWKKRFVVAPLIKIKILRNIWMPPVLRNIWMSPPDLRGGELSFVYGFALLTLITSTFGHQ